MGNHPSTFWRKLMRASSLVVFLVFAVAMLCVGIFGIGIPTPAHADGPAVKLVAETPGCKLYALVSRDFAYTVVIAESKSIFPCSVSQR